jgi:hypothetical protein
MIGYQRAIAADDDMISTGDARKLGKQRQSQYQIVRTIVLLLTAFLSFVGEI